MHPTRKGSIGLIPLICAISVTLLCQQRANAGFTVTVLQNTMTFKVNSHIYGGSDSNLNSWLTIGGTNTNSLDVGFAAPPSASNYILLQDTFGNLLRVYAIGGVYLTNGTGTDNTATISFNATTSSSTIHDYATPGDTLPSWFAPKVGDGAHSPPNIGWEDSSSGGNFNLGGSESNFLAYQGTGSAGGKTWTQEKGQYGTFGFNNLATTGGTGQVFLGMDVFFNLYNSSGVLQQTGQTGWVTITGASEGGGGGGEQVPEASTMALLAFGGLPVLLGAVRARKRS